MKKKILVLLVVLCVAATAQVYAFGLGAQLNFSAGEVFAPGLSLVLSPSRITHLAFNWYIDFDSGSTVGLAYDLSPVRLQLMSCELMFFNFTLGIGLFSNLTLEEKIIITSGLRIPVGFSLFFGRNFEVYTHVAPSYGVNLVPSLKFSNPFYPIALGARLWIKSPI